MERFCLWEQLAGIADILSQAPCAMYTDNAVGNVVAETGRDGGTTTRLSDRSMPFTLCASPLKGEVQRSPEPSARPSAAADSEERQICTTCFFAESVGLCLCFLPSSAMYKDNEGCWKRGSGDGQRLGLYDHGTTERSFNAVERRGSTLNLNSLHGSRLRGTANLYDVLIRGEHWIVKSRRSCMLEHTSVWSPRGDPGKRGDLTWQPAVKHQTTCQNHKQQQLRPRSGPSKGAQTRTTRVKVQQVLSKYRKKESN